MEKDESIDGFSNLHHPDSSRYVEIDPSGRYGRYNEILGKGASKTVFRLKHRRVNNRAVKRWCRQILRALLYLHSQDPPVIHRDLKCDNIFVNGNQGEIKIGDLGLAAILRKSHADRCVGTPEFMAPEVYEEAYNELGEKPAALYKVKDPSMRQFVEKCLAPVPYRLSARELLSDPFLQIDDCESKSKISDCQGELDRIASTIVQPFLEREISFSSINYSLDTSDEWRCRIVETEPDGTELFEDDDDDQLENVDNSITGKIREDGSIVLRLRIADKEGRIRNIYFPFDTKMDTALTVATEMIAELDITDQDVTKIAEKIDGEIASLVPEWKPGPGIDETPRISYDGDLQSYDTSNHPSYNHLIEKMQNGAKNSQILNCSADERASAPRHFEQVSHKEDQPTQPVVERIPKVSNQHYQLNSVLHEGQALSSHSFRQSHSDQNNKKTGQLITGGNDIEKIQVSKATAIAKSSIRSLLGSRSLSRVPSYREDKFASQIHWEIRWLWN